MGNKSSKRQASGFADEGRDQTSTTMLSYTAPPGQSDNAMLSEQIITSSAWMLHYSPNRHKRKIQFKANGSIGKGRNDWEHSWKFIKTGEFATLTKSGDPDVIFTAYWGDDNRWYLSGGAHTLVQI